MFERVFRPADKRNEPWVARCRAQNWLVTDRITQADITTVCVTTYLNDALGGGRADSNYHALASFVEGCEKLPMFSAVRLAFDAPST